MIETSDMSFEQRMVTPEPIPEDGEAEFSLRPKTLSEYIGQDKVKENMAVYIEAAKRRGDVLDHVLLYGPPGLGKTTLSGAYAEAANTNGDSGISITDFIQIKSKLLGKSDITAR